MGIPHIVFSDSEMCLCYFDDFFVVIGSTEGCHFDNAMNTDMRNKLFDNQVTFNI